MFGDDVNLFGDANNNIQSSMKTVLEPFFSYSRKKNASKIEILLSRNSNIDMI